MKTFPLDRLVALAAIIVSSGCASLPEKPVAQKPNVVVILADDMGYSDLGCYGSEIATPNLDRLAGGGLRFKQFYNTARCWPSRACILTGYYAQQVNRDTLPEKKGGGMGKRPEWARLLPELLKPYGYRSYHSGKWHVDGPVLASGFDHSYSLNDHDRYFDPRRHELDDKPLPPVSVNDGYYATTAIAQHAIEFLGDHAQNYSSKPFFLYLPFISPHFPLHAPAKDIAVYKDRYTAGWDVLRNERFARQKELGIAWGELSAMQPDTWPSWNWTPDKLTGAIGAGEVARAVSWDSLTDEQKQFQPIKMVIHAAMVHRMDIEIGRVIAQLKKMGVYENTIILFASDNGASAEQIIRGDLHDQNKTPGSAGTFLSLGPAWSTAANTPFRFHKSWVHEGGISTPLIVQWPAGIAAHGELRSNPGHLIDIAPTILELAGGKMPTQHHGTAIPTPPGKSLVPAFTKDGSVQHDYFWWCHDNNRAIRVGDWKLVADHDKPWELFNLTEDRSETKNLAEQHPEKVRELEREWNSHTAQFGADAGGKP